MVELNSERYSNGKRKKIFRKYHRPSNIMVKKWMPQSDILAHPHVILFISHGGLFGTIEAIYSGIPLLFIPIYGDRNIVMPYEPQKRIWTNSSI